MFGERTPRPPEKPKYEQLILVLLAIGIAAVTTLGYGFFVWLSERAAANQP